MFLIITLVVSITYSCHCQTFLGNLPIVSDLEPEHCFTQDLDYIETDPNYGLPKCTPFDVTTGVCSMYRRPNITFDIVYKPTCSKDGEFAPKQCKGERTTGRCFCFNATGGRIFGQEWWTQADDMTCACSRKKVDMVGTLYFNSLHCNARGNFEPLQCDVTSGQCWCADEKTGALTSAVVPEKAMSKLPCYNYLQVGSQYLRQCENKRHAMDKIAYKFSLRGTKIHHEKFLCGEDGSFGAFAVLDGSAYCTWRDNSKIDSYQSGTDYTSVNCNCARDTKYFSLAGKSMTQKCMGNGNYEEFQKLGSNTYCVDVDGYRKSPANYNVDSSYDCSNFTSYNRL